MKKKFFIIALPCTVLLLLVSALLFFLLAVGYTRERDGVVQHSRMQISNAKCELATHVRYVVENNTCREVRISMLPVKIEKLQNGAWVEHPLTAQRSEVNYVLAPFSELHLSFRVDYLEELEGQYRLIHSVQNGTETLPFFIVGDLEITSEDTRYLCATEALTEINGIKQVPSVQLHIVSTTDANRPYGYILQNGTGYSIEFHPSLAKIEEFSATEQGFIPSPIQRDSLFETTQTLPLTAHTQTQAAPLFYTALPNNLPRGLYRISIPCHFKNSTHTFWAVTYVTI